MRIKVNGEVQDIADGQPARSAVTGCRIRADRLQPARRSCRQDRQGRPAFNPMPPAARLPIRYPKEWVRNDCDR